LSCQLPDAIDEVFLRIRKQFPNVAGHVLESVFETLRTVLLRHVRLAFDDSDVDRFLAFGPLLARSWFAATVTRPP